MFQTPLSCFTTDRDTGSSDEERPRIRRRRLVRMRDQMPPTPPPSKKQKKKKTSTVVLEDLTVEPPTIETREIPIPEPIPTSPPVIVEEIPSVPTSPQVEQNPPSASRGSAQSEETHTPSPLALGFPAEPLQSFRPSPPSPQDTVSHADILRQASSDILNVMQEKFASLQEAVERAERRAEAAELRSEHAEKVIAEFQQRQQETNEQMAGAIKESTEKMTEAIQETRESVQEVRKEMGEAIHEAQQEEERRRIEDRKAMREEISTSVQQAVGMNIRSAFLEFLPFLTQQAQAPVPPAAPPVAPPASQAESSQSKDAPADLPTDKTA